MKRQEIVDNIGQEVMVTGDGDLAIHGELRPIIFSKEKLTIVKLTKGGKAYLVDEKGIFYSVPPKNVVIYKGHKALINNDQSSFEINAKERKLRCKWTIEIEKDISTYHSLNIDEID